MSLLEVTFVMGLAATLAGIGLPPLTAGLEELRTRAAVRYLAGRLQRARVEAITRSVNVAVRFTSDGDSYRYGVFADGNDDGIRSSDIDAGVDFRVTADERLSDHFRSVIFGALPGLPAVDPYGTPPGSDPVRLGASDLLVFTPLGTATPGSLYVRGDRRQYVVRILGETGRTRVLSFSSEDRSWRPL
jgi:hypothetical protein